MSTKITAFQSILNYSIYWCRRSILVAFLALIAAVVSFGFLLKPFALPVDGVRPGYTHPLEARLLDWSDPRLQRRPGEGDYELVSRLNNVVFRSFFHCDPNDQARPIDHFAWWTLRILAPRYLDQGFLHLESVRCGYCHQAAYILSRAASLQGAQAYPWGLNGHVVVLAYIEDGIYVFDPDFGVGPINYIEYNQKSIKNSYSTQVTWSDGLASAYRAVSDDHLYFPVSALLKRERIQSFFVLLFESIALAIVVLAAMHTFFLLLQLRKQK